MIAHLIADSPQQAGQRLSPHIWMCVHVCHLCVRACTHSANLSATHPNPGESLSGFYRVRYRHRYRLVYRPRFYFHRRRYQGSTSPASAAPPLPPAPSTAPPTALSTALSTAPPPASPTPWAGVARDQSQRSPPGVADLPAQSPLYVANYYDTRGYQKPHLALPPEAIVRWVPAHVLR